MIKERAWPAKAMYLLIAAALAISLIITAIPAQKVAGDCTADVCAEWEMVPTPTTDGWVLAPESMIIDYHTASADEVAYAIVYAYDDNPCDDEDAVGDPDPWTSDAFRLLKSDDYAATWSDLTEALEDEADDELFNEPEDRIEALWRVATDWEEADFVAVVLWWYDYDGGASPTYYLHVFISTDGGATFIDAGEVEDAGVVMTMVSDLVVSPEAGGKRDIFIGGAATSTYGAGLFRCTVTGDSPGAWEDVTDTADYEGWDNMWPTDTDSTDDIYSEFVTDLAISPSWTLDKTVLATTVAISNATGFYGVYLQSGSMGTSPGWNMKSSLGFDAVEVKAYSTADVLLPTELAMLDGRGIAGLTLPEDYNSKNNDDIILWVWVNYWDSTAGNPPMCDIMRVEEDSADLVGPMGQIEDGEIWLTNISYHGTIDQGEAMAGVLGDGGMTYSAVAPADPTELFTTCCEGVQVYRNNGIKNMDICCERWHDACKPPTGVAAMAVTYVGDDKAYAVALMGVPPYEEGAWSVTFDDGDTWNQLSLIDTDINYLSDVAVSPDCNKTMLVSVNIDDKSEYCLCDSVWLHADELYEAREYDGQWLRTWCGELEGDNSGDYPGVSERGLLRLAPEELEGDEVRTVFLVDRMSGNVYWNDLETLACWDPISSTSVSHIVDLVAQDKDTLFALDASGDVSMFDNDEWQEEVDSKVEAGWAIAVWDNQVLVGGQDGDVSYSADFDAEDEDTFTELENVDDSDRVYVNVAFDSYFDTNKVIYAALAHAYGDNGIYLLDIDGETEDWTKLAAEPYDYTGLVLDRAEGNPYTSDETGGVLYASYQTWGSECDDCCGNDEYDGAADNCWHSGVARCLNPIVEICCGAGEDEWSYLTWGLDEYVYFSMQPQALKICGCLTEASNSKLFAIDSDDYDMCEGEVGTVWTFEDCYAKKQVVLNGPDDGYVVGTDMCDCCNAPFKLSWDRLCDACCYEIQFAMDKEFTDIYLPHRDNDGEMPSCYDESWFCPDSPNEPSFWTECWFDPEFTYYWRVRAIEAETCQDILSWWSDAGPDDPWSFTVGPTASAAAIDLVAPVPGATGVGIKDVGFSWDIIATVDEFDWVLWEDGAEIEDATVTDTYYQCTVTLEYGTTYSWQVTAKKGDEVIKKSAVGTFTTAVQGEFCCPQCGLCFETQEELEDHLADAHPAQAETPFWVWVIIVIGAVLVIVVIVLIFRTRRV